MDIEAVKGFSAKNSGLKKLAESEIRLWINMDIIWWQEWASNGSVLTTVELSSMSAYVLPAGANTVLYLRMTTLVTGGSTCRHVPMQSADTSRDGIDRVGIPLLSHATRLQLH